MKTLAHLAAIALFALASNAQEGRIWPPPHPPRPPRPPRPWIIVPPQPQDPGKPMELREMSVTARIVGLHVEVTTTMTFFNPNRRQLEGELQFPLPDGALITGYALDINGQMVDGVVVKKEKARVAFETEVRRGVDPGIVEHLVGNVYRTRIYPLPAQGTRKIRLKYVAELPSDKNGDAACFLPMPIGETVGKLAIHVEVSQGAVKPEIGGFGNLRFQSLNNLWVAETEVRDAKPGEDIWIVLPKLPPQVTAIERAADGDVYFAISDLPILPQKSRAEPKPPRQLGIAWDASGSRDGKQLQKEIAVLKGLLSRWPETKLTLLVFRDRPETARPVSEPMELKDIAYDGGTDLAGAADAIRTSDIDHWLLFTDGLDTLSDKLPDFGGKNVTAVVSQTVANRELLRQSCGSVIDLQRVDPEAAAFTALDPAPRLLRVNGTGIAEVQGIGATADGRVSVHGKLTADSAELCLEYSNGYKSAPVTISKKNASDGTLLASVWAAKRVNQLAVRAEANEDELLSLGQRFGIVSPATSLIVLENVEQYVRHDIEPPASQPEWRREWNNRKATMAKEAHQKRASKLDRVLALWKNRVEWWEKKYDQSAKPKPVTDGGEPDPVAVLRDFEYNGTATAGVRGPGGGGFGQRVGPPRSQTLTRAGSASATVATPAAVAPVIAPTEYTTGIIGGSSLGEIAGKEESVARADATITVKPWNPAVPYLKALKQAPKADRYAVYLDQRYRYAASPAFFVDCAEYFLREGDTQIGVRVLTNLAELKLEEASLLRVLAWRLQQAGELDRAIVILRRILKLRPEEPQSFRDLALALAENGKPTEASELLAKVVMGEWDRFDEIEVIALEELNALLARTKSPAPSSLDSRLIKNLDVDVRIVMSWDADDTDVDLHVVEPSGEEAYYSNNRTASGGLVSKDFTQGYGPEEYMMRRGLRGPYRIFAHYYGSRQQTVIGPCTVTATVFTDFGRPTQKKQILTLRLDKPHEKADIGEIQFGGGKPIPSVKAIKSDGNTQSSSREAFRDIQVGQRSEAVKRLLGEPQEKKGALWNYQVGDRKYQIRFSDSGRVVSVIEILSGGGEMILTQ